MRFIESLKLAGLLSFPPDMEPFELEALNVLIGPNGSGKSNFIEAFELLRALPTDFAMALAEGGGVSEWVWKGSPSIRVPQIGLPGPEIGANPNRQDGVWYPERRSVAISIPISVKATGIGVHISRRSGSKTRVEPAPTAKPVLPLLALRHDKLRHQSPSSMSETG